MRKTDRKRVSRVAVGTAFLLTLALNAPSTIPAIPDHRPEPPTPEEVVVLEELLDWIRGGARTTEFKALQGAKLIAAVSSRPRSFELFRTYNAKRERLRLLQTLPYADLIRRAAERHRLDSLLIAAVMEAESGFDPLAVSPDGARGLMQVMPTTADLFGVAEFVEPAANVDVGARYLSGLMQQFDGDLPRALAAYNAGPGNVTRFEGVPPFEETRRYVERVLGVYVDHHLRLWKKTGARAWLL